MLESIISEPTKPAHVGGKAAVPLEMLQLKATLPTKPEVDVSPIESLLPETNDFGTLI
jgi:hypothetical protein